MALYYAYLDESYGDSFPVFAVGGYLFRAEQARLIEADWKVTLSRYGVPYFHMTDVNACRDVFEPLGKKGCDDLAREVIALTKKYMSVGVVTLCNAEVFAGLPEDRTDAYTFCLTESLDNLIGWLQWFDPDSNFGSFSSPAIRPQA